MVAGGAEETGRKNHIDDTMISVDILAAGTAAAATAPRTTRTAATTMATTTMATSAVAQITIRFQTMSYDVIQHDMFNGKMTRSYTAPSDENVSRIAARPKRAEHRLFHPGRAEVQESFSSAQGSMVSTVCSLVFTACPRPTC